LDLLLVSNPQFPDFISTLAGLVNLFPGAQLFLLEESNAVGKKLGVSLHSIMEISMSFRL